MANDTKSLTLRIKGDVAQAKKEFAGLRSELGNLGGTVSSISGLLKGVFAAAGIGLAVRAIISNSVRAEQALAQVEARIKATGAAAGFTAKQLAAQAAELQKVTTFGDEDILEMQAVLLTFRNVQGDVFRQATEAALNLSTALGQDAKSSALQLGKALENPVQGLTALRRIGVQFTDEQEKLIKGFVRTGDAASAQQVILARVEQGYGGAARAARDTLGGSLKALREAFGDLLEAKGGMEDAREGIEALVNVLQDPQTVAAVENIVSVVVKGLSKLAEFTTAVHFLIAGPADEIGKLDVAIDKIDRKIGALRNSLNVPRGIRAVGSGFDTSGLDAKLFESDESVNKRLAELVAERAQLIKRLDDLHRERGKELLKAGQAGAGTKPTDTGAPPPSEDFTKAIADLEKRIALLGKEFAAEQMLFEVQQGRYKDLAQNEKDALVAAARQLDAAKDRQDREKEDAAIRERLFKAEEDYNEELKKSAEAIRDTIDPARKLFAEMAKIDELYRRNKITLEEWMDATLEVQGRLNELGEDTKKTTDKMTEFAKEGARGMQSAFAEEFFDILEGKVDNLGESFVRLLHRLAAELAASEVMQFLTGDFGKTGELGGALGGLFASLFHDGGVVGAGGAGRRVPALAFAAPQYLHGGGIAGLRDDEVPAILKKGERVLTEEQLRGGRGAGDIKVSLENRGTPQQAVDTQVRFDAEGMVIKVLLDDLNKGGRISSGLGRTFNLRRR
jgi:hypothetical protein